MRHVVLSESDVDALARDAASVPELAAHAAGSGSSGRPPLRPCQELCLNACRGLKG